MNMATESSESIKMHQTFEFHMHLVAFPRSFTQLQWHICTIKEALCVITLPVL